MQFFPRYSVRKKCCFRYTLQFISTTSVKRSNENIQVEDVSQHDHRLANAKPFDDMPKITSLPFVGSAWIYFPIVGQYNVRKLHLADRHKHEVYGDVVRERIGKLNVVSSFRAEDMETIVRHEGKHPIKDAAQSLKAYRESRKEWYSNVGVFLTEGKEWQELRAKIQPHFMKPKAILAYLDPMQDFVKDFSSRIHGLRDENGEVPNLLDELYKWALEAVAFVGLDIRFNCLGSQLNPDSDDHQLINAVKIMQESIAKMETMSGSLQFWKYFTTPTWKKFSKASDVFTQIVYKHLTTSFENLRNVPEDRELSLLQALISNTGMDISNVMGTVADLFFAGFETTSHTSAYFMYQLAKNPDKQEKLYQDLKRIFPSKSDKITIDTFNELRYMKSCLKETLRLNPIARSAVRRTLDHDVVLSGYRVPAGTLIMVLQHVLGSSEKYFTDPDKFIPERWTDKKSKPNPLAHLPFGYGVRSCLGRRFAELEVICLLTEIVRNYRLEYHHEDIDAYTNLNNVPDRPLRFKFIDR